MANEIEIRVGAKDNTGAGFASVTAREGKLEAALLAHRKAALAAADADAKMTAARAKVATVAEKVAKEELTETDAVTKSAAASRDLERASIGQAEAHKAAAAAAAVVSTAQHDLKAATSTAASEASAAGGVFKKMFSAAQGAAESAVGALSKGLDKLGEMGPAAVGGIAVAIAALPAVAIGVGAAITLALGGALAGVAIMAAAKNAGVAKSFTDLKTHVSGELTKMAQPFVPVLEHIATVAGKTFDSLSPALTGAFKGMAPAVSYFADSFGKSMSRLGPTITKIGQEFSPLLMALGDQMPTIMDNIATGIEKTVSAVSGHEGDFAQFVVNLSKIVSTAGEVVSALAPLSSTINDFTPDSWGSFFSDLNPSTALANGLFKSLTGSLGDTKTGFDESSQASWDAQKAITASSDAMVLAKTSADDLTTALDTLSGGQLSERAASRAFQAAIDDMTASLKKNGHTFDTGTAKGRANQAALDKIASSGIALSEALQKVDKSGKSSAASMNETRAKFIAAAEAGHMSHDAAIKLADAMGLVATRAGKIPSKTETKILGNIHDLQAKVDAAKAKLKTVPPSRQAAIKATIAQLEAQVKAAKKQLAGIQGKTVDINMRQLWSSSGAYIGGRGGGAGRATGGVIGGLATGGVARGYATGGVLAMVGEAGRELVRLPYGSTVIPNGQTEQMVEDGDYDDDGSGYATGGVVSRKKKKKTFRRASNKKVFKRASNPSTPYNWNISDTLKEALAKNTATVQDPDYVPTYWGGQSDDNFGPGGAHFSWSAPRPAAVTPPERTVKLTAKQVEANAHDAIAKRAAEAVKMALKEHKSVIEIHSNGSEHSDYILKLLRNAIRTQGGNVQVVLGK